jgi:hypothetical protein
MTGTEIATLIIAAYGAVLSTFVCFVELVRGTRGIAVRCGIAVAARPSGEKWEFVVVEAVNKRPRPVTITGAGLRMSDGNSFTQVASNLGRNPLPSKLGFGDMVKIWFDLPELEKVMAVKRPVRVLLTRAFVRDAEDKEYAARLPRILKDKGFTK